jgi:hypothetical protein
MDRNIGLPQPFAPVSIRKMSTHRHSPPGVPRGQSSTYSRAPVLSSQPPCIMGCPPALIGGRPFSAEYCIAAPYLHTLDCIIPRRLGRRPCEVAMFRCGRPSCPRHTSSGSAIARTVSRACGVRRYIVGAAEVMVHASWSREAIRTPAPHSEGQERFATNIWGSVRATCKLPPIASQSRLGTKGAS